VFLFRFCRLSAEIHFPTNPNNPEPAVLVWNVGTCAQAVALHSCGRCFEQCTANGGDGTVACLQSVQTHRRTLRTVACLQSVQTHRRTLPDADHAFGFRLSQPHSVTPGTHRVFFFFTPLLSLFLLFDSPFLTVCCSTVTATQDTAVQ
jgi:hypothetical protein